MTEIVVQVPLITPNGAEAPRDVKDTTMKTHARVEFLRKTPELKQGTGLKARGTQRGARPPQLRSNMEWQRANDVWPNSTGKENRRRTCRCRCYARTKAVPINCRSRAASSMVNAAIMSPAAPSRRRTAAGACTAPDSRPRLRHPLCQNVTGIGRILRCRTRTERTGPESGGRSRYRRVHG